MPEECGTEQHDSTAAVTTPAKTAPLARSGPCSARRAVSASRALFPRPVATSFRPARRPDSRRTSHRGDHGDRRRAPGDHRTRNQSPSGHARRCTGSRRPNSARVLIPHYLRKEPQHHGIRLQPPPGRIQGAARPSPRKSSRSRTVRAQQRTVRRVLDAIKAGGARRAASRPSTHRPSSAAPD